MPGRIGTARATGMKGNARSPQSRASRPPLERMLRIHQAIQAGDYPNASSLAREMEVSSKSIHRDLEFMRDRLDLPLEYEAARGGYHTEAVSAPTLQNQMRRCCSRCWSRKRPCNSTGAMNFEKPCC